jgi:hypothetical protein
VLQTLSGIGVGSGDGESSMALWLSHGSCSIGLCGDEVLVGVLSPKACRTSVMPLGLSSLHTSPLYLYSTLSVPPDCYLPLTGLFGLSHYLDT